MRPFPTLRGIRRTSPTARRLPALALSSLVAFGAALVAPAPARAQISVDQVEVFLAPGLPNRQTAVVNVANVGDKPIQATLYINDWDRDLTGDTRFFPVGQVTQSCRDRVQIFPTALRLEPRSEQAVRITYSGPDSLRQACWNVVFVEMADLQPVQGRVVQYVLRAGVKIYVEPAGLTRDGAVEDMRIAPHTLTRDELTKVPAGVAVDSARSDVSLLFRNHGGIQIRPVGRVEIRRQDNSLASTVNVDEFPVLPGAERRLLVPLPTLPAGKYIAIALLDFGGAEIAGGQVEFERR